MAALWQSFLEAPDYYDYSPWFPNPAICVRDIAGSLVTEVNARLPWNGVGTWMEETWNWISQCHYADTNLMVQPICIAVTLTLLRFFLNWILMNVRESRGIANVC